MPFRKILVPYDGSKQSDRALERAAGLAADLKDAQLILMHVVAAIPTPVAFGNLRSEKTGRRVTMSEHMEELYEAMEESARAMLEAKRKEKSASGLRIGIVIEHGKPADRIVEYAAGQKVDLIVIGSVGAGTISKMIRTLGSVSRAVSEKASCPVMIVH